MSTTEIFDEGRKERSSLETKKECSNLLYSAFKMPLLFPTFDYINVLKHVTLK